MNEKEETLQDYLREHAKTIQPPQEKIDLKDVGDKIRLKWVKDMRKTDQNNQECIYVVFDTEDTPAKTLIQKYTATMFNQLADSIEACGGKQALMKTFHTYKKIATPTFKGRSFPRLYPQLIKKS